MLLAGLVVVAASCTRQLRTWNVPGWYRGMLLETTSDESANVSIGDLNGDGNLDIVLVKGRHSPALDRVLFGDGRGGFPTSHDLGTVPDRSYSGRLVDIDGDGDLDVVISNDSPDPKLVYLNDGEGNFHVGSTYGHAEWPTRNASVADMNGDSLTDIVVANRTGGDPGANYICLNKGKGEFDGECVAFSHESATTITPADFNGDGLPDLVVPHRDGGQSYVYLSDVKAGFPNFRRVAFGPGDAVIRICDVADLNGDGRLDIVAIDERRGLAIYFGQRDGTFGSGVPIGSQTIGARPINGVAKGAPYALIVGDLNLDGKFDIVVGYDEAPSVIYFNDGSGRRFTPLAFGDGRGRAYGFAIADLNRDGRPDIALARSGAPNVVFFAQPSR